MSKKYTKKEIAEAVEVLRCCADLNYLPRNGWMITNQIADELGADRTLPDLAWVAAYSMMEKADSTYSARSWTGAPGHAEVCLEAAQMLEEGWLP